VARIEKIVQDEHVPSALFPAPDDRPSGIIKVALPTGANRPLGTGQDGRNLEGCLRRLWE